MTSPNLYAVIMAGGSGARFWPASRRAHPKQFLPIAGDEPMLVTTAERIGDLVPPDRLLVATGRTHVDEVRRLLPELPPENILAEPVARNTLPCLVWATREVARRDPGALLAALAADHVIEPVTEFHDSLLLAAEAARGGSLVTLGIRPDHPATGYGYLEVGEALPDLGSGTLHAVRRFVEKPDADRAAEFMDAGSFLWNSGMFLWTCEAFLSAIGRWCPEMAPLEGVDGTSSPAEVDRAFEALPSLSVDVGLMERADNVVVLPVDYSWNDVGAWSAIPAVTRPDGDGNFPSGGVELVSEQASGCVVHGAEGELVAILGVEDLVIVRSGRTTLVCTRENAEQVRSIVTAIEASAPDRL